MVYYRFNIKNKLAFGVRLLQEIWANAYLHRRVDQSKTVQARITKSLPSAAWKTLVSGTVNLFHKFKGGQPERGC